MNSNIIEGNPTKTFFIDMITRDISIKDAIIDLLDNLSMELIILILCHMKACI